MLFRCALCASLFFLGEESMKQHHDYCDTWLRECSIIFTFVVTGMLVTFPASAFLDSGGRISRELAVGEVGGVETLYATWQGGGGKKDNLTLFAFCADGGGGDCGLDAQPASCTVTPQNGGEKVPGEATVQAEACDADDSTPCKWKVSLPYSRGDVSYAPPAISDDGRLIVVGTRDQAESTTHGRIFAFDENGNCEWVYEPGAKDAKNGFYARLVVHETGSAYVVVAANKKSGNLHMIRDSGSLPEVVTISDDNATLVSVNSGEIYFEPIVDTECCGSAGCQGSLRVYAGVHGGSNKRGIYAFDASIDVLNDKIISLSEAWRYLDEDIPAELDLPKDALAFRIGGVLVASRKLNAPHTAIEAETRFIVGALRPSDGVVAIELNGCNAPDASSQIAFGYGSEGTLVKEVHRTRPVHLWEPAPACNACPGAGLGDCPANCQSVVYVGQKQGFSGNSAAIHRFTPQTDAPLGPDARASWSWPHCITPSTQYHRLKHTSWASPVVDKDHGNNIYLGTNQDTGVYQVLAGATCPLAEDPEWFPYRPAAGWRTTAEFSGTSRNRLVHMGDSYGVMYSVDAENTQPGVLAWCYDMRSAEGTTCPSSPGTCCDLAP
jgi:hypothetical protein